MRLGRQGGIYRSDGDQTNTQTGPPYRLPLVGPEVAVAAPRIHYEVLSPTPFLCRAVQKCEGPRNAFGPIERGRRTASRWSAPRLRWPHREFTMRFCRRLLFFAERFKNARALEMRLFRQGGIYRSDVSSHLINLVPGSRFTVGSRPGYRTRRKNTPCPSSAMSSGRLFLDRVARQHCPSPLHRHTQINMHSAEAQGKGDISTLPGRGHFYFA